MGHLQGDEEDLVCGTEAKKWYFLIVKVQDWVLVEIDCLV